jgi:hypothetical protein
VPPVCALELFCGVKAFCLLDRVINLSTRCAFFEFDFFASIDFYVFCRCVQRFFSEMDISVVSTDIWQAFQRAPSFFEFSPLTIAFLVPANSGSFESECVFKISALFIAR